MTIEERAKEKLNSDGWWGLYGRTKLVDTYIQGATDQDPISRAAQKKIDIEKACECYRKTLITHYGADFYNKNKEDMEIVEGLFRQMLEQAMEE